MKKKVLSLLFVVSIVLLLTACGNEPKESDNKVGGWELNTSVSNKIPTDKEKIFSKAIEKYTGMELEPIAYLGSQVVSGTNYMYLCKATTTTSKPETSFKVVVVYENLDKEVELKEVEDFDIEDYVNKDIDIANEELTGGWIATSEAGDNSLNTDEDTMFDKATQDLVGVDYKPVAVLATQVVSGTNYAILSLGETVTEEPVNTISIITIYKDLDNNVKVLSVANIDLADFND